MADDRRRHAQICDPCLVLDNSKVHCTCDCHGELLLDPDCRDGKHRSCVGGPCECSCHEEATP